MQKTFKSTLTMLISIDIVLLLGIVAVFGSIEINYQNFAYFMVTKIILSITIIYLIEKLHIILIWKLLMVIITILYYLYY